MPAILPVGPRTRTRRTWPPAGRASLQARLRARERRAEEGPRGLAPPRFRGSGQPKALPPDGRTASGRSPRPALVAPRRRPAHPGADWFRQALARKPTKMPVSPESALSDVSHPSSPDSPPSLGSSSEVSPIPAPSHGSADGGGGSGNSGNSSGGRWSKDYDVCVCHSEEDLAAAQELVSYLEGGAASLRCFLQLRDATPGGAIVSELCHALSSSHCRVLLITPGFLRDPWCRYQMLQALSEAPGAEGRTIPLMSGLSRAAYPAELRYMYFVDGRGPEGGFRQVKEAVMRYLQTLG
ncbi:toll/interleukin-1 receptor domain-containing adapter protein isoform X1 [Bos indicus]|uniref:Toll/interleukin-1 receptor domain-containing adapter protein isoform X1 n=2 Tax=Bos indicus TaxID=9915 RepID=A0ABM4RTF3_BOSIN|nr:toll/interleukin-1 receptor domain-containing adapter protein isoform X1 [Bos taurus]